MQPVEAKDQLHQWLRRRGIDPLEGPRHQVKTREGSECLLWLPERDTALFVFIQIATLTMPQDNVLLTLSMALNLDPSRTGGAALGYNPESNQLLLRSVHPMDDLDDEALDRIMTRLSQLAGSLQRYLKDFRHQEKSGRAVQKEPRVLPSLQRTPRPFMT